MVDVELGTWGITRKIAGYVLWASYEDQLRTAPLEAVFADPIDPSDPEIQAIARLDLAAARRGLDRLTPAQRASILNELGVQGMPLPEADALKMLRMRARRALRCYIERGGVFVAQLRPRLQDAWRHVWPNGGGLTSGHETTILAGFTLVILVLAQTPSLSPGDERRPPLRMPETAVDAPVHLPNGDAPPLATDLGATAWSQPMRGIAREEKRPKKRSGFNLIKPVSELTETTQARTLANRLQASQEQRGLQLATAVIGDLDRAKDGKLKRKLRVRIGLRPSKR